MFITDGVDTPGGKIEQGAGNQATGCRAGHRPHHQLHGICTTGAKQRSTVGKINWSAPTSADPIAATDPTLPPGQTRSPAFTPVGISFDPAMNRQRKAYEAEVKKSQQMLTELAEETGGQIFLPKTSDEMVEQAREAAREVGAEYVVTYRPKRPLASADRGEYRRIEVASRRVGLSLRSRRGYVVPSQP